MAVEESGGGSKAKESSYTYLSDEDEDKRDPLRRKIQAFKDGVYFFFAMFSPSNIKNKMSEVQAMSIPEIIVGFFKLIFYAFYYSGFGAGSVVAYFMKLLLSLMRGPGVEEPVLEVKEDDIRTSRHLPALPPTPDESQLQVQAFGMDITREEGQIKLAAHESMASTPQSSAEETGESSPEEGTGDVDSKIAGEAASGESELPLTLADLLG